MCMCVAVAGTSNAQAPEASHSTCSRGAPGAQPQMCVALRGGVLVRQHLIYVPSRLLLTCISFGNISSTFFSKTSQLTPSLADI